MSATSPNVIELKMDAPETEILLGASKPLRPTTSIREPGASFESRIDFFARYGFPRINLLQVREVYYREGYFRRVVDNYNTKFMRGGFTFISRNEAALGYVRARYEQMEEVGSTPFRVLSEQVGGSLFTYNNAFVWRIANDAASGGRAWTDVLGVEHAPVAGYFCLDPCFMKPVLSDVGRLRYWLYQPPGLKARRFSPGDIIHMARGRLPGSILGVPMVHPAIDDIRTLRAMEESIELLVHQETVPLYVHKVGNEKVHAVIQPDDLTEAAEQLRLMLANGGIAIPWYNDISILGAEGKALDAAKYLDHFKRRIFTTLGVSALDMGEADSANHDTAGTVSETMIATTREFQELFIDIWNREIRRILREGGWTDVYGEDAVYLFTPEIDIDSLIKKEEHVVSLWQNNLVTLPEARKDLGRDPITEEEERDLFVWVVTNTATEEAARVEALYAPPPAPAAGGSAKKTLSAGRKTTKNVVRHPAGRNTAATQRLRPKNQYGRKTGPGHTKNAAWEPAIGVAIMLDVEQAIALFVDEFIERIWRATADVTLAAAEIDAVRDFVRDRVAGVVRRLGGKYGDERVLAVEAERIVLEQAAETLDGIADALVAPRADAEGSSARPRADFLLASV